MSRGLRWLGFVGIEVRRVVIRYVRFILWGCAGFNRVIVSLVSFGDVILVRVVRWELRVELCDLLIRMVGGNVK